MSPTCPRSEVLCDIARCAADPDLPAGQPVRVVTNAHRINPGEYRQLRSLVDFFLFHADDADTAAGLTVDVTPAATSRC